MILIQIRKIEHRCTNYIAYIKKKHMKPKGTRIPPTNYKHPPKKKIPPITLTPTPQKKKQKKKSDTHSPRVKFQKPSTFSCLFFLADVALISN